MNWKLLTLLCAALSAGCAQTPTREAPATPEVDPSMRELNAVAKDAQASYRKYLSIKTAEAQSRITRDGAERATLADTAVPRGWERTVTLDQEVSVTEAVAWLAKQAGYNYFPAGIVPANPPVVIVQGENKRLIDYLRDVMAQSPENVSVFMYPATTSVVVRFAG